MAARKWRARLTTRCWSCRFYNTFFKTATPPTIVRLAAKIAEKLGGELQDASDSPVGPSIWDGMTSGQFLNTPDGSSWLLQGDDIGATNQDAILVVDDAVVIREGQPVDMSTGGTGPNMAAIFWNRMIPNGDWISRGDDPSDNDWVVRNGELIAQTGGPIDPALRRENWGNAIAGIAGNNHGDYIIVGNTDNADPGANEVMVYYDADYNVSAVIAREGDPVDLDGNGMFDDDAYIGRGTNTLSAFAPNDDFLTDQKMVYFLVNLRDGSGNDLNSNPAFSTPDAFLAGMLIPAPAI